MKPSDGLQAPTLLALEAREAGYKKRIEELTEELESARAQVTIAKQSNGFQLLADARIEELEGALHALRLQALQSSVNDPANEWGMEALNRARSVLERQLWSGK